MTAPAAPLEKAVEQARDALATVAMRYPNGWGGYDTLSVCTSALTALLAALDADRGEAEAALREVSASPCFCVSYPDPEKTIECGRCIARRYFARREEKEVPE